MVSGRYSWLGLGVVRGTLVGFLTVGAMCVFFSESARAEIASDLEPDYAEAVLNYNSQNYDRALAILDQLQTKSPKTIEFLELKAIALKATKKENLAADVYRDLVQIKSKEGKDKAEIAPYSFELGVLRFNEKKYQQAEQYFNYSAKNGFNVDISKFYIGLVNFQTQNWAKAQDYFKETLKSELEEIKPAAHLYSAQAAFKMESPAEGFDQLIKAKNTAQKYLDREDVPTESKSMAEQVRNAAASALAPFDKSQFFGSFSLLAGYDSNALLTPTGDASSSSSKKTTVKNTLSAGLGYASSPLSTFQWVPSLRSNFNYNWNKDTKSMEFADTTLSLYVTRNVLAAFAYGLKTEATSVFQNDYNSSTGSSKYRAYSNSIQLAPYLKWEARKAWTIGSEFGFKMMSYKSDATTQETLKKGGDVMSFRLSAQNKANRPIFNPTYVLKLEKNNADGTEYQAFTYGVQVLNTFKGSNGIDWSQAIEWSHSGFGSSSTDRSDSLITAMVIATKKIGPRWALLCSVDYSTNSSSDETQYSYSRFNINSGLTYNF